MPALATLGLDRQTWTTVAYYVAAGAGIALLVFVWYRLRVARIRARERDLERLVEERTRELRAATRALEESNERLELRVIDGIDKLREAERMAAYGLMVAGVAHEVRNPLFALGSAAYVLGQELKDRGDLRAQIALIERESRRLAALMDELLEFARPPALLLAPAEIADILAEAVIVFKSERGGAAPEVEVRVEARDGLGPVVLDRSRVVQVLVNLMENALRHGKGVRTITLGAAAVSRADPSGASDWAALEVKDDGEGIGREHLPRLFEPFYTTGKGTGLGLAIVRRIVSDHEGTIEVASEPGQGTRFAIFLPVRGPLRRPGG